MPDDPRHRAAAAPAFPSCGTTNMQSTGLPAANKPNAATAGGCFRRSARYLVACGVLAIVPAALAAPRPSDILVVADVTAAGKAAPAACPEHPVYYEAAWVGFRDLGAIAAGEREPPVEAAKQSLTDALRAIGYLAAGPDTPPPTVAIFFAWGTLNPDTVTTPGVGSEGQDETVSYNSRQMLAFLGAHKVAKLAAGSPETERLVTSAREDQYFLAVAAYDRESLLQHRRKLLWMTRIATDSLRVWLPQVLPSMVATGAQFFGKDAELPVWVNPADPKAEVKLGPLEVLEFMKGRETAPAEPPRRK